MNPIKITTLEVENVKRVKAVRLAPGENGLTIIGGKNGQGKTSVLDAIAWALGGEKFRPSDPARDGSVLNPSIHIKLSNGLVVERAGKNSTLKVTDPSGRASGQTLLNDFVEKLALNLPAFLAATPKEKANTLLGIIGVGEQLAVLDQQERRLYDERLTIGRIADQKSKFAQELPTFIDAPKELVSASELIKRQQTILARNAENQRLRDQVARLSYILTDLKRRIDELQKQYDEKQEQYDRALDAAQGLHDDPTDELEQDIENVEEINRKVRANLDREKAEEDARHYSSQYETLTDQIDEVRTQRAALLNGAKLPLPGLSVDDGELTYNGHRWDCMSGAEQLRVATAIVRHVNPNCGFVLLDKLEQMDADTLAEFGAWLEGEGLQAIATRVSTGGECSIIIEDGSAIQDIPETPPAKSNWKAGEF
jgi:predicted ATP-dependent endonuclease of OLD family